MTLSRVLSIALAVLLANLFRAYYVKYKAWKAARPDVTAYRNWRGVYVPDLKIKRIERGIVIGWVLLVIAGFVFSYVTLTNPDFPRLLNQ